MPGRVDARRILVIHNPTAGWRRPRLLQDLVALLRAAGRQVTVRPTLHPAHAIELAGEADRRHVDMIVAAGGDGTINEVLNGLQPDRPGEAPIPLALCPLGTANVLAQEIGLRLDAASLADCILQGRLRWVALGECRGPAVPPRVFIQMLGVGFDAQVVADVSRPLKNRLGRWAYVLMSGRQAFGYHFPAFRVRIDGRAFAARSVIVANGRHYGGRYVAAPEADLERDSLEVCLFRHRGPLHVARYGVALLAGRLSRLPDVTIHRGREVEILGPAAEPVQGDGDLFGLTPVSLSLAGTRQPLVVPASQDAGSGR
ncbi:MAG: diacylglycerol kinase family lipid kinase [Sneathiellaceae bacterium]